MRNASFRTPFQHTMAPYISYSYDENLGKEFDFGEAWHNVWAWIVNTIRATNIETIQHPWFISFALIVVWAWPHILVLPIWFGKDAYRRIEHQTRVAANRISSMAGTPTPRPRRRDAFVARYRAIVGAGYTPEHPSLFGGTPLTDGEFAVEDEKDLPIALRVIRWSALAWAAFIVGREGYYTFT